MGLESAGRGAFRLHKPAARARARGREGSCAAQLESEALPRVWAKERRPWRRIGVLTVTPGRGTRAPYEAS